MLDLFRRAEGADQRDLFEDEEARQEREANKAFRLGLLVIAGVAVVLFGVL